MIKSNKNNKSVYYRASIAGLFILSGLIVSFFWYRQKQNSCEGIVSYVPARDRDVITKLFNDNWYWLVPTGQNFDLNQFLDAVITNKPLQESSATTLYIYCHEGKPIGFVAYFRKSLYLGVLRFIALAKEYRGKGFSQKLMQFALDDMHRQGITVVQLTTRLDNTPALKLYDQFGFKAFWQNDQYIRLEKNL